MTLKDKWKLLMEQLRAEKEDILPDPGFIKFEQNEECLKRDPSFITREEQYDIDNGKWIIEDPKEVSKSYCKK
ncbi:MAG: hypothetical protein PHN72_01030 [Bacilli bacterium]|nr:hypothetical protein [Bacilli bacterium]